MQGLVYLFLSAFYILMGVLPCVGSPALKRGLNALVFTLLACFMLITFGSDNRCLAPALNRVLLTSCWTLRRRGPSRGETEALTGRSYSGL